VNGVEQPLVTRPERTVEHLGQRQIVGIVGVRTIEAARKRARTLVQICRLALLNGQAKNGIERVLLILGRKEPAKGILADY